MAVAAAALSPGAEVAVRPRPERRGRLLRWLGGKAPSLAGGDPGLYDPRAVSDTVRRAGFLFGPGRYFRVEARGWENVPPSPVMVVSNHSGGTTIPDVWGFGLGWYTRWGVERPLHVMAHEIVLSTRTSDRFFGKRGVLRADPDVAADVLARWRRDLLVMPGGDLDTWRPYRDRYRVRFGGRTGYARLALRAGIPIVPVANAGAHETLFVLTDGEPIARALRLPKLVRARIFPVHVSLPWGLAVGPWPHLPLPARLRYRIGAPIVPTGRGGEPSDEEVADHDAKVRAAVQALLDELRAEG